METSRSSRQQVSSVVVECFIRRASTCRVSLSPLTKRQRIFDNQLGYYEFPFFLMWIFSCLLKLEQVVKDFPQQGHLYGRSPVWDLQWVVKSDLLEKDLSHFGQMNGFGFFFWVMFWRRMSGCWKLWMLWSLSYSPSRHWSWTCCLWWVWIKVWSSIWTWVSLSSFALWCCWSKKESCWSCCKCCITNNSRFFCWRLVASGMEHTSFSCGKSENFCTRGVKGVGE